MLRLKAWTPNPWQEVEPAVGPKAPEGILKALKAGMRISMGAAPKHVCPVAISQGAADNLVGLLILSHALANPSTLRVLKG